MSSQKGNVKKTGPPKHQNAFGFKNSMHDTSGRSKAINDLKVEGCCQACKEVIEWKIKYKKYKPLTVMKKCIKCEQKTIKHAYCIVCIPCAAAQKLCEKCGKSRETIVQRGLSETELHSQQQRLDNELQQLPERKRRTFLRLQAQGKLSQAEVSGDAESLENNLLDDVNRKSQSSSDTKTESKQDCDADLVGAIANKQIAN